MNFAFLYFPFHNNFPSFLGAKSETMRHCLAKCLSHSCLAASGISRLHFVCVWSLLLPLSRSIFQNPCFFSETRYYTLNIWHFHMGSFKCGTLISIKRGALAERFSFFLEHLVSEVTHTINSPMNLSYRIFPLTRINGDRV